MQHAQDLNVPIANAIRHDVGQPREDQFAGAEHSSRPADAGVLGQQGFNLIDQLQDYARRTAGLS